MYRKSVINFINILVNLEIIFKSNIYEKTSAF